MFWFLFGNSSDHMKSTYESSCAWLDKKLQVNQIDETMKNTMHILKQLYIVK